MKLTFSAIAVLFTGILALSATAQTTAPPVTAPQAVPVKIAVIDTDEFNDPKTGVKKLLNALSQVEARLKPMRDEIVAMQTRYNAIATEVQNAQKTGVNVSQAKIDEAQQLESDIKRKQEDGQKAYTRFSKQLVEPVNIEIAKAVEAYARTKNYDMVLDLAKFVGTMMVLNQSIDITKAFIADYNAKNPAGPAATTAAATPAKP
jgi:Skp family chaperone for outer membrane proteins